MKRFALLTDANTFPILGAGAALMGCVNDNRNFIKNILLGKWKRSGYDKAYLLSETLNDADNVRDKMAELIDAAQPGDVLVLPVNSSHGTHFIDYITGEKMSCTVCHNSDWNKPRSFLSKLDYQRAFTKLKPGVRAFAFFDSCESGNMGSGFRLLAGPGPVKAPRWLEPPPDIAKTLAALPMVTGRGIPSQVCTLAGCTEDGTCADVQGDNPHGAFSWARDTILNMTPTLPWSGLANGINALFSDQGDEQRCVPNGPDVPFDAE